MGINQTIYDAIKEIINPWDGYGCDKEEIKNFLSKDFDSRKIESVEIAQKIMTAHGKQEILRHFKELSRIEDGTRNLTQSGRDHVVHALLSYLLGIYINEYFLKPLNCHVKPFMWKLSGLLHDIGYPLQVATNNIINPFFKKINETKKALDVTVPDIFFQIIPTGLDKLTNNKNSLDLIQRNLDKWNLKINARKEYEDMIKSDHICHGIISSLTVLYIIDLMYHKYNPERKHADIWDSGGIQWNQSYFDNEVLSACSAIFVHNLPERCFSSAKLAYEQAPLAFLLLLSDCMQDWDRPTTGQPYGLPDNKFDIRITTGQLIFIVADNNHREKIRKETESKLDTSNIVIR